MLQWTGSIMDQQAFKELTRMLESFPQTSGNPDLTVSAYELAVQGLSSQAIIEACQRFISGFVEGQSMDFAPAAPRFAQEARRRQEYIDLKARPRLPAPQHYTGTPWHIRQEKARTKFRECPIIKENVSYDEFRKMSAAREVPVGGAWVASLATVFGPPAGEIAARS
jgi:hypothetical protein